MTHFNYDEFTTRNIGFVTPEEQIQLKNASVFIPGVGGMGGAALMSLARAGVENFIIADFDVFEVSNLNRQLFADLETVGIEKTKSVEMILKKINPNIKLQIFGPEWIENLTDILPKVDLCINGTDDHRATIKLMRAAKIFKKVVIDAYASTLPSVYVVKPTDPRPEEFLKYPTLNKNEANWTEEDIKNCAVQEIIFVLNNSSTFKHVIQKYAIEMLMGKRKRMSFSPMVFTTGNLMCFEAVKVLLNRRELTTFKGYFFNPWKMKIERPLSRLCYLLKLPFTLYALQKHIKNSGIK